MKNLIYFGGGVLAVALGWHYFSLILSFFDWLIEKLKLLLSYVDGFLDRVRDFFTPSGSGVGIGSGSGGNSSQKGPIVSKHKIIVRPKLNMKTGALTLKDISTGREIKPVEKNGKLIDPVTGAELVYK